MMTIFFAGGLLVNVWQWMVAITVENLGQEMQTNFEFFVSVWLIPMMLSLVLEFSWEDSLPSSYDSAEVDRKTSTFLEYVHTIMKRRKQSFDL